MRKVTSVRPKELNLFNRDFGNLKQFILKEMPEFICQIYSQEVIAQRLFESGPNMNENLNKAIFKLIDEEYRQQIEDHLQIATMSNDIILENEYDDMKRKSIKCSKRDKSTMDIIIEEFSSKSFIQYICEEQVSKNESKYLKEIGYQVERLTKEQIIGTISFNPEGEIETIKLPETVIKLIDEVIKSYPELCGKSKLIQTNFICKVLVTANMLLYCDLKYLCILEKEETVYVEAIKKILSRLEAWKNQLFFYTIRGKVKLLSKGLFDAEDVLSKYEREVTEKEQENFKEILDNIFLTNIAFGILLYSENAITMFYKLNKERQNIIKNYVVKMSEKIKQCLENELKEFNIHDLENVNVSEKNVELAAKIQMYLINYKWLEVYVRDDQVKKKGVEAKAWNLYNNISKTVLTEDVDGFYEAGGKSILRKIENIQETYSLNSLCNKNFDKLAFWCIMVLLETGEVTTEQFTDEQQKRGVSVELINLFYTLTKV